MKEIDSFIKVAEMLGWEFICESSSTLLDLDGDDIYYIEYLNCIHEYCFYYNFKSGEVLDVVIDGYFRSYSVGSARKDFLERYKSYFRKIKIEKI